MIELYLDLVCKLVISGGLFFGALIGTFYLGFAIAERRESVMQIRAERAERAARRAA